MAPCHGFQENRCRATERFNGRISDVLRTNRFDSALDLEQTLMQAMKDWHKSHPHLFVKSPRNHAGRDSKGSGNSQR
jgi:hypothetical protein